MHWRRRRSLLEEEEEEESNAEHSSRITLGLAFHGAVKINGMFFLGRVSLMLYPVLMDT